MKQIARTLRKGQTDTERLLWYRLRNRQLEGFKFRRQYPVGPFIVDFVCLEQRLVVEADGGQHAQAAQADKERQQYLEARGYRFLRFWNNEVLGNIEGVLSVIMAELRGTPAP